MNNMEWVDYMNDANELLPDYPFATPSEYVISNVSNNRLQGDAFLVGKRLLKMSNHVFSFAF